MPLDSWDTPNHLFFITAATSNWVRLFKDDPYANVLLESFEWHRTHNKFLMFAFVVMPSHWHAIIKPSTSSIGNCLQSFCSFTAHRIIDLLRAESRCDILDIFHVNRRDPRSDYSVWQEAFSENIFSEKFLSQKMEYIHDNPVRGKKLVQDRADYLLSSARFYDYGIKAVIEIDDIHDFLCGG